IDDDDIISEFFKDPDQTDQIDDDLMGLFCVDENNGNLPPSHEDENDQDDDEISEKIDYKGKKISAFTFQGSKYEVSSWKELLITVCNLMNNSHESEFDKVLTLKTRKCPYFSIDPSQLQKSEQIQGTNIYVEINLTSNQIVRNVKNILALFKYSENSIS
ncbi:MAG: hypothetical protein ACKPEZ_16080, partial [Planktothrix sp.]